MKVKTIFLWAIACFTTVAFGQVPDSKVKLARMQFISKQVIPPAPEAASLGQYGNVPVSLFTGNPNIRIPLFDVRGNSLSLPISLSYNASGFKPGEAATWSGSGWTLNAGGVITRAVIGNPDDTSNYFGHPYVLSPPSFDDMFTQYAYMEKVKGHIFETQPDIYYYNFAGHAGKFFLKPDNTVFKKEVDMKLIASCINCSSSSFTIVDEDGIIYVFDQVEFTRMTPNDEINQMSPKPYLFPSAWYLRKMQSADLRELIEFEYHTTLDEELQYRDLHPYQSSSFTYGVKSPLIAQCRIAVSSSVTSYVFPPIINIQRKFLKKITLKREGKVVLFIDVLSEAGQREDSYDSISRRLNHLKIYSKFDSAVNLLKQYDFSYGYFQNEQNAIDKKRLRLDSLQEISVDGITPSPPPYRFTYDTQTPIPERSTASIDHWGYYNRAPNNGLIPKVHFAARIIDFMSFPAIDIGGTADRSPDFVGASTTMLRKIIYPTGGYTTFDYEQNLAKFDNDEVHTVGGIRIKSISDYSLSGQPTMTKEYSYISENGTTSGRAGNFPEYTTQSTYHYFKTPFNYSGECEPFQTNEAHTLNTISVAATSIFGLGSYQGSPVGYARVTEARSGGRTGKTVYEYQISKSFERDDNIQNGDLLREVIYGNHGKKLHEKLYDYGYTSDTYFNGVTVRAYEEQNNNNIYCKLLNNSYASYGVWQTLPSNCLEVRTIPILAFPQTYSYFQQSKKLVKQVMKTFNDKSGDSLIVTKKFTYGSPRHRHPTLISESSTNGDSIITSIKYVADYSVSPNAQQDFSSSISRMQSANILGIPIEKLQYRLDVDGANKRYTSGELTDYSLGKPTRIYFVEGTLPITNVVQSAVNNDVFSYDNRYKLAATFTYNNAGNLVEQSKTNDIAVSYLWDYASLFPVAEIVGASYDKISYTSFETSYKGGFNYSGSPLEDPESPTGKKCYDLAGSAITGFTDGLNDYILSYWRNGGSGPFNVTGSNSFRQGATRNGWTLYEHTIRATAVVTVSGIGKIDELRLYPAAAQITTYTFEPFIGTSSKCDLRNNITYYDYDGLSRLSTVREENRNMVKRFRYNFGSNQTVNSAPQSLFYNLPLEGLFSKNCPLGKKTLPIRYIVPYGKYVSTVSQHEADQKAIMEFNTNGQIQADAQLCQYFNVKKSGVFTRSCPAGTVGVPITYTVPADTHSSESSQQAADMLAQTDVFNNGPSFADEFGICAQPVNINCTNGVGGVTAKYTDNATGNEIILRLLSGSSNAQLPPGIYTVKITVNQPGYYFFSVGCLSYIGASPATFYNVAIADCHSLVVENY